MVKFIGLITIILVCIPVVLAATSSDTAIVKLYIINDPPNITDVQITPEEPFEDDDLSCSANYTDDHPEIVTLNYRWYRNGILLGTNTSILTTNYTHAGDQITCGVMAFDLATYSDESNQTAIIQIVPTGAKLVKTALSAFGVNTKASSILAAQSEGTLAVTGFAVREVRSTPGAGSSAILIFIITALVIGNIYFVVRFRKT